MFTTTAVWRRALTVVQVAVSVTLLFAAGLFIRNLSSLRAIDPGYTRDGLSWAQLELLPSAPRSFALPAYLDEVRERVAGIAGVRAVAFSAGFPTVDLRQVTSLLPAYRAESRPEGPEIAASREYVSPGFFAATGIPLLQGHDFAWSDVADRPRLAIINVAMASQLFPDEDPIGRQVRVTSTNQLLTVMGIAGNATRGDPRLSQVPTVFTPMLQDPPVAASPKILVSTNAGGDLATAIHAAVAPLARHYVSAVRSADAQTELLLSRERVLSYLATAFAVLGIAVSTLGLYGLLAYAVARRRRELGLRMALGATPARIVQMIVGEGVVMIGAGLALGLPLALASGRLARSLLFSVSSYDVASLAASTVTLTTMSLCATWLPANRAAQVELAEALRDE